MLITTQKTHTLLHRTIPLCKRSIQYCTMVNVADGELKEDIIVSALCSFVTH